jgi:hypothetical protein
MSDVNTILTGPLEGHGAIRVARRHRQEHARGLGGALRLPEAAEGGGRAVREANRLAVEWQPQDIRLGCRGQRCDSDRLQSGERQLSHSHSALHASALGAADGQQKVM